jgi:hypothetical protein
MRTLFINTSELATNTSALPAKEIATEKYQMQDKNTPFQSKTAQKSKLNTLKHKNENSNLLKLPRVLGATLQQK